MESETHGSWPGLRDYRIKASEETVAKSLVGDYRPEHIFTLRQSLDAWLTGSTRDARRAGTKHVARRDSTPVRLLFILH